MASNAASPSLQERLADALPLGVSFSFHHLSTPPTECDAIFSPPPGAKPHRTYCESHFLTVSITPPADDTRQPQDLLILAIEILTYTTKHLTTLFVSKADSTGHLALLNLPKSHPSPIRTVATSFVDFLVLTRQRPGIRLVVSLFARAQDQYLFPGSVENPTKHVLDDRGLVKWWCRVLDPVLRKHSPLTTTNGSLPTQDTTPRTTAHGFLIVPGFDKHETTAFLPPTWRSDPPAQRRWQPGHPLLEISTTPLAPPRCLIPHFPDDPKARFLDELDEEVLGLRGGQVTDSPSKRGYASGMWKSVRSLDQFWDTMAFRQECSSGRLVGFIWVVFTPGDLVEEADGTSESGRTARAVVDNAAQDFAHMLPTPAASQQNDTPATVTKPTPLTVRTRAPTTSTTTKRLRPPHPRPRLTGPIITRPPRIKSSSTPTPTSSLPETTPCYSWPASSRGTLVVSAKDYKRATDLLLRLDFATRAAAALSSRRWVDEVAVLAGQAGRDWAVAVVGRREGVERSNGGGAGGVGVQVLSARKRKKGDQNGDVDGDAGEKDIAAETGPLNGSAMEGVTTLNASLVRKKVKTEQPNGLVSSDTAVPSAVPDPGVNLLGSGLVRKKPKVT